MFFVDGKRGLGKLAGRPSRRFEAHDTDIEIFLETVHLQEIGKLEGADVSALGAYFLLEISNHALEFRRAKAGSQELIPEPLPIEAQRESLTGPLAVEFVEFAHRLEPVFAGLAHRGEEF